MDTPRVRHRRRLASGRRAPRRGRSRVQGASPRGGTVRARTTGGRRTAPRPAAARRRRRAPRDRQGDRQAVPRGDPDVDRPEKDVGGRPRPVRRERRAPGVRRDDPGGPRARTGGARRGAGPRRRRRPGFPTAHGAELQARTRGRAADARGFAARVRGGPGGGEAPCLDKTLRISQPPRGARHSAQSPIIRSKTAVQTGQNGTRPLWNILQLRNGRYRPFAW